jgi:hypothetical protein
MSKAMQILNSCASLILVFILAVYIGNAGRVQLLNESIKETKEVIEDVKKDELPLENGSHILLEKKNDRKVIYISYEDFKELSKSRRNMRKTVENIEALFLRMEE